MTQVDAFEKHYKRSDDETVLSRQHFLGHADCKPAKLMEAERLWGGPLPGCPLLLEEDPLRCTMLGFPPARVTDGIEASELMSVKPYWLLKPGSREVVVYHSGTAITPLPELPAGVMLPGVEHEAAFRDCYSWDEIKLLTRRVYAFESVPGSIEKKWPDLAPEFDSTERPEHWFHGIEYDPDTLEVSGIRLYVVDLSKSRPFVRDLVAVRRAASRGRMG